MLVPLSSYYANFLFNRNDSIFNADDSITPIYRACGSVTRQIRILAEMQSSVEMAQAITYQIGPHAHLRKMIVDISAKYSSCSEELGPDEVHSGSVTDDNNSYATVGEKCTSCQQSFKIGALAFHQELRHQEPFINTRVYLTGTVFEDNCR
jgi:hypothetical protein